MNSIAAALQQLLIFAIYVVVGTIALAAVLKALIPLFVTFFAGGFVLLNSAT